MTIALLAALCTAAPAHAQGDWSVVLNGRAIHMNAAQQWNEDNWGLGFEKEFDSDARWVKVALGNAFRDSLGEPSYMAGGGMKRRFRLPALDRRLYVDLGAVGFLMTRNDVNSNQPFPGVLPAMTIGTRSVAVNLTYLPDAVVDRVTRAHLTDPDMKGVLFLQVKLNARLFGFGDRRQAAARDTAEPSLASNAP